MKFKTYFLLIIAILLVGAVSAQNASAQDKPDKPPVVEDDDNESPEKQKRLARKAKIKMDEAKAIALARVAGEVIESEIEKEDGMIVWEFEIKDAEGRIYEVCVNADNGDIVEVELEDEDEEDEEDDDDTGG